MEACGRTLAAEARKMIDPVLGRKLDFCLPPLPDYRYYQGVAYGLTASVT